MKNSEPKDEQEFCRLDAKYNEYTLCDIVPRLIIEARPTLPYSTCGLIQDLQNRRKRDPFIEFLPDRVWDSSELKRDTSNLVRIYDYMLY